MHLLTRPDLSSEQIRGYSSGEHIHEARIVNLPLHYAALADAHLMRRGKRQMGQAKRFRCKDVGYECEWHLEGKSEEEMLPVIEKHAAEVHNLTHFKGPAVEHVLDAIRRNG